MGIGRAFATVVLLCFSVPAWAAGNLPVETLHLDRKSPTFEIAILYPRTGMAVIDAEVARWAKAQADNFEGGKGFGGAPFGLDISYTITRNDRQMFETLFEIELNTGGAHPNHTLATLNFVLPGGERVYLAEIVGAAGIAKVSQLAEENLTKELTGDDGITDVDWIRRGVEPYVGNFEIFTVMKDTLVLYFPEYTVAAYGAGPQKTEIPLRQLRGVMRDNWRTPQPSFECEKAVTPVEQALCADVTLARLDRKLAEAYWWKVKLAEGEAGKTRERNAQRAFLARRDAGCAQQTDAALTQCLIGAYRQRLKAFAVQPD